MSEAEDRDAAYEQQRERDAAVAVEWSPNGFPLPSDCDTRVVIKLPCPYIGNGVGGGAQAENKFSACLALQLTSCRTVIKEFKVAGKRKIFGVFCCHRER